MTRLAQRIRDCQRLIDTLGLLGPNWCLACEYGGLVGERPNCFAWKDSVCMKAYALGRMNRQVLLKLDEISLDNSPSVEVSSTHGQAEGD